MRHLTCALKQQSGLAYFIRSQRDFSAAPCAAAHGAVVAEVPDAVRELGGEADLAGGVELDAGLALKLGLGANLTLQTADLFLLLPRNTKDIVLRPAGPRSTGYKW